MSEAAGRYYVPHGSNWPITASIGLFTLALGFVLFLNNATPGPWIMTVGGLIMAYMMFGWFGTVVRESEAGKYNDDVDVSFRMGMSWFIFSEVMFFAAFFGALYYVRNYAVPWLADTELLWPGYDGTWPTAGPEGQRFAGEQLEHIDAATEFSTIAPWKIPFLNTAILLTSSVTITIAHWALKVNKRAQLIFWLGITVVLGFIFVYFQAGEYIEAYGHLGLTLGTGVYGATFFMLTGFHGLHVTIGAIILTVILIRCICGHFRPEHHFAFEAGAWYWHFVDTVWVGLFFLVYIL